MGRAIEMGRDRLILPGAELTGCLFGALLRDTRGWGLAPDPEGGR